MSSKITLDQCKERVKVDLEREMGITQALMGDMNQDLQEVIAEARQALEPVIEQSAWDLYCWYHKPVFRERRITQQ